MNKPSLSEMLWVPWGMLSKAVATRLMKQLTVTPKVLFPTEEPPQPIKQYAIDTHGKRLGLPVDFGLRWLKSIGYSAPVEDYTCWGHEIKVGRLPDPHHPKAPKGQANFFHDMYRAAENRNAFLVEAQTGTGKTVGALNTIGLLKRTALIVVGTRRLARQWRAEATLHLGIPEYAIGLVQEGCADWQRKSIVPAVVHNLAEGQWPEEFYRHFGIVCWDEAHHLGAKMFARTLKQFPATYRWGMTATPKRKDGCEGLFLNYFGNPYVIAEMEPMPMDAYVLDYQKPGKGYGPKIPLGTLINCLTKDVHRNELIAHTIKVLYANGRQILVLSDRIEHLHMLMGMAINEGVPWEKMGLYTGEFIDVTGKRVKHTDAELDEVKDNAQIIFGTYGMLKEAIDIPRLDAGIDATPRSEGNQVPGRVRRPIPGKKKPVWFTIRDIGVPKLIRQCNARLGDYQQAGITVIEGGHHGKNQS